MAHRAKCLLILAISTAICLSGQICFGQVASGEIRGLVTDPAGAVIPGVEVQATNLATNERFSTVTTDVGGYIFGNLPVGNYRVEAELPGFKRLVQQPVNVSIGTTTSLNLSLEIGEVSEQVTVERAVAPLLKTEGADHSTTMEQKFVFDLPLQMAGVATTAASGRRTVEAFIYLTPGITGSGWNKHFLGSPQHTTQAIIDGVPFALQESPGMTVRTPPPYEAVEEFTVSTTMYPANLGRGFGITNYSLKSGTNNFHGNAFWIVRNDALDARGFFASRKPIIRQNEFGFTLGGPIVKDKTFFFGAFDGFRRRGGTPVRGLETIPSLAFRKGDFSELKDPTGQPIPIFDPATTKSDGKGGFVRDPFPNNIILANRISPIAKFYMDQLPAPDLPGIVNNFVNRRSNLQDDDSYSVKISHTFNERHRVSGSYFWALFPDIGYGALGNHPLDIGTKATYRGLAFRVNWDWTISPILLNHFGWGHQDYDKDNIFSGKVTLSNKDVGIKGLPEGLSLPSMAPAGYLPMGGASAAPEFTFEDNNVFTDTVNWTRGRHLFKFGGEYWNQQFNRLDQRAAGGVFNFSNLSTSQPNSPLFGRWGDGLASMLLGEVFSAQRVISPLLHTWDTEYYAFFVDDKIQLTPRLTVSLGLRYDYPTPIKVRQDAFSTVDLALVNPAAGGRPGAYVFGRDAARLQQSKNEWAPRLALAYAFDAKTVVRAGYGLIYAQSNAQTNAPEIFGNRFQSGFAAFSTPSSLNQGVTPAFRLDDGFPAFQGKLPNTDPGIEIGGVADWISPASGRSAYTSNWNLTVQRELPSSFFVDLTYVGVKGTRLPANTENPNQVPAEFLKLGALLNASIDSPAAQAAGIARPFPTFRGSVAQALRPFAQYTTFVVHWNALGNHTYNALLAKVQRRFSQGLGMLISYTLSKNISDTNGNAWSGINNASLDTARRRLEKAVSPIDNTHNLVTNWIYELPFGEGLGGAAGKVLKGWQVAVTTSYLSGPPLGIAGGPPLPLFGGGNRPNRVQGVPKRTDVSAGEFDPARHVYLNLNAFAQPTPFTFGNVGRVEGDLRGFSSWSENVALSKRTFVPSIAEQFHVEFRAEFFNLFNRTVFRSPSTNINGPTTFGRVFGQANEPRLIQFGLKVNF